MTRPVRPLVIAAFCLCATTSAVSDTVIDRNGTIIRSGNIDWVAEGYKYQKSYEQYGYRPAPRQSGGADVVNASLEAHRQRERQLDQERAQAEARAERSRRQMDELNAQLRRTADQQNAVRAEAAKWDALIKSPLTTDHLALAQAALTGSEKGKPGALEVSLPAFAPLHLRGSKRGPWLAWMPLWSDALHILQGNTPILTRQGREWFEQDANLTVFPPGSELAEANFALAVLAARLLPWTKEETHPPDVAEQVLLAQIIVGIAAKIPSAVQMENARPHSLAPATAALIFRAATANPHLVLPRSVRDAITAALRKRGVQPLDEFWEKLAEPGPAVSNQPSTVGLPVDPRALLPLARAAIASPEALVPLLRSLRPTTAAPQAWNADAPSAAAFRQLVTLSAGKLPASSGRASGAVETIRHYLEIALTKSGDQSPAQLEVWAAHHEIFRRDPAAHALGILSDAAEGSPDALLLLLDSANKALAAIADPDPAGAIILDRLARQHPEVLRTPAARGLAAWAMVLKNDLRPLSPADVDLAEKLLVIPPRATRADGFPLPEDGDAIYHRLRVIAFGFDRRAAAMEEAAGRLEQNPHGDSFRRNLEIRDFEICLHLAKLENSRTFTPEQAGALLEKFLTLDHFLRESGPSGPKLRCAPHLNVPLLVERQRRIEPRTYTASIPNLDATIREARATRGSDRHHAALLRLHEAALKEKATDPRSRGALDALVQEAIRPGADPYAARLLQPVLTTAPSWWGPSPWPGKGDDKRADLRINLRQRAEALAVALLWWRDAPEQSHLWADRVPTLTRTQVAARIAELATTGERRDHRFVTDLMGRDLEVGGLATRALLLAQTMSGDNWPEPPPLDEWLKRVAQLPPAVPAADVLQQLVAVATNGNAVANHAGDAAFALAAASDRAFQAKDNPAGPAATRALALKLLAKHADKLPGDWQNSELPLIKQTAAFLKARVAWEIARAAAPAKSPAELAAPIVQSLGPIAPALAFHAHRDVNAPLGTYLLAGLTRQIMLEDDMEFSPGILRALAPTPTTEELVRRYVAAKLPGSDAEWQTLLAGRVW